MVGLKGVFRNGFAWIKEAWDGRVRRLRNAPVAAVVVTVVVVLGRGWWY